MFRAKKATWQAKALAKSKLYRQFLAHQLLDQLPDYADKAGKVAEVLGQLRPGRRAALCGIDDVQAGALGHGRPGGVPAGRAPRAASWPC